ncbi:TIGR02647 family protein [Pseudomonas sp. RIT-PI-S]|uniref:TIGR02647 family protein n=1 Tax=Pseudomonas sp. RIT-PI-S TaxID=3035295 RepID=UPI0021DA0A1C|nr:TIGR02647 family protein [Pseudomonas sp. RIT-PI-S]
MTYSPELIAEIELLSLFNLGNTLEGLKVHQTATPAAIAAAARLHEKELITLPDGGYLTSLGLEAAQHAQALLTILRTTETA